MNPEINIKKFYICTTGSIFSTIMIAISNTLISTFAFYELLTLFTYPLISNTNTNHEKKEARFYLYFLISTSSIILFPLILFLGTHFSTVTFKVGGILNNDYAYITPMVILVLYGVAKAAIIPVHFWLPRAMVAPIPVSALLHAVAVVKSGIFIIIKMYIYIFGIKMLKHLPSWHGVNIITILCALSMLLSAIIAIYQVTLKKLLAYSTINQLSLCLLAASLFTVHGIKASILHLLSHAVSKITLFFTAGYIYSNARITKIKDMNGLAKKLPVTSFMFAIGALSVIGIPPLAGFISKAYILYAAIAAQPNYLVMFTITASIILSTHYFGTIIYKIYFQKMDTKDRAIYSETSNSSMIVGTIFSIILVFTYIICYPYIISLLERINY
ncbi:MAG: cation:proton antiporter [Rickettsiales bacterium]|nr:cation:proton antiporter [Rickettsiales bacterium]